MAPSIKRFNTNLVKLVGQYTKLKQTDNGKLYVGRCPFHKETFVSRGYSAFVISVKAQRYFCFDCRNSGDYEDFETEIKNRGLKPLVSNDSLDQL